MISFIQAFFSFFLADCVQMMKEGFQRVDLNLPFVSCDIIIINIYINVWMLNDRVCSSLVMSVLLKTSCVKTVGRNKKSTYNGFTYLLFYSRNELNAILLLLQSQYSQYIVSRHLWLFSRTQYANIAKCPSVKQVGEDWVTINILLWVTDDRFQMEIH